MHVQYSTFSYQTLYNFLMPSAYIYIMYVCMYTSDAPWMVATVSGSFRAQPVGKKPQHVQITECLSLHVSLAWQVTACNNMYIIYTHIHTHTHTHTHTHAPQRDTYLKQISHQSIVSNYERKTLLTLDQST